MPAPDLSAVRAVFFDLDDTLCGYWDASKAGLRKAFETHGPEGHETEGLVRHWAKAFREFAPTLRDKGWYERYLKTGEPTRTEQMRLTLGRLGIDDPDHAARLSEAYMRERDAHLALFPDAITVLDTLRPKYRLGLITNGPADIQRQEIATLGIESYFDPIYIEGELGFGKPVPEVFARAAAAVNLEPHQILMVGNSYGHDIKPARAAGWYTAWIRRPSDVPPSIDHEEARPEELPAGDPEPTMTITELSQLLPHLG